MLSLGAVGVAQTIGALQGFVSPPLPRPRRRRAKCAIDGLCGHCDRRRANCCSRSWRPGKRRGHEGTLHPQSSPTVPGHGPGQRAGQRGQPGQNYGHYPGQPGHTLLESVRCPGACPLFGGGSDWPAGIAATGDPFAGDEVIYGALEGLALTVLRGAGFPGTRVVEIGSPSFNRDGAHVIG